jgi:hypothetical protein
MMAIVESLIHINYCLHPLLFLTVQAGCASVSCRESHSAFLKGASK